LVEHLRWQHALKSEAADAWPMSWRWLRCWLLFLVNFRHAFNQYQQES
jgi:hypothetical protein